MSGWGADLAGRLVLLGGWPYRFLRRAAWRRALTLTWLTTNPITTNDHRPLLRDGGVGAWTDRFPVLGGCSNGSFEVAVVKIPPGPGSAAIAVHRIAAVTQGGSPSLIVAFRGSMRRTGAEKVVGGGPAEFGGVGQGHAPGLLLRVLVGAQEGVERKRSRRCGRLRRRPARRGPRSHRDRHGVRGQPRLPARGGSARSPRRASTRWTSPWSCTAAPRTASSPPQPPARPRRHGARADRVRPCP